MPIWQILAASVKETLGRFSVVPSIDFDKEDAPEIPAFTLPHATTPPSINIDHGYNPFKDTSQGTGSRSTTIPNWEELYKYFERTGQDSTDGLIDSVSTQDNKPIILIDEDPQNILQFGNKYLITLTNDGILILDQHRAHLTVLYERLMKQIDGINVISQRLLFPEIAHFTAAQNAVFEEIECDLEKAGFGVSRLSGGDWSINSVPPGLDNVDVIELLNDVINQVSTGGNSIKDRVYENIALTIATRAAIPSGRQLNEEEMKALVNDWKQLQNLKYSPNGKLIANVLSLDQVSKMF